MVGFLFRVYVCVCASTVLLSLITAEYVLPFVLDRLDKTQSREIFTLGIVVTCLFVSYISERLGLAIELGKLASLQRRENCPPPRPALAACFSPLYRFPCAKNSSRNFSPTNPHITLLD